MCFKSKKVQKSGMWIILEIPNVSRLYKKYQVTLTDYVLIFFYYITPWPYKLEMLHANSQLVNL